MDTIQSKNARKRLFNRAVLFAALISYGAATTVAQNALKPIIQISANVYEYRLDHEKQLGLFYQYNRDKGSVAEQRYFYFRGRRNVKEEPLSALDVSGSFTSFTYGSIDYNLKTAISDGHATLINHQRAMVSDGNQFLFIVGEEIPLTVIEMKGTTTTLKTENRATGVKLKVTPRVFRETNVLMGFGNRIERNIANRYLRPGRRAEIYVTGHYETQM